MPEFLHPSDAFVWSLGSDARFRSTIVTLLMMDKAPDWRVVSERFAHLTTMIPRFRCRISPSPGLIPPRWVEDPDFDLGFHVRRVHAARPGTRDVLLEMARLDAMTEFDTARPPWTVTLIEGAADGAALLCKLHHSLSDGVGAVALAATLFDQGQHTMPPGSDRVDQSNPLLQFAAQSLRAARNAAHPLSVMTSALSAGTSIGRAVRPIAGPRSSIMMQRTKTRRLCTIDADKSLLANAGHTAGGSINDAFLAAITGGLRRYHDIHGRALAKATVMMPISVRSQTDPAGGNRATLARFDVPVWTSLIRHNGYARCTTRLLACVRKSRCNTCS